LFENGVIRKIYGPKKDEMIEAGRNSFFEKLHDWYSSRNEICVIKPIRMKYMACGVYWGQKR